MNSDAFILASNICKHYRAYRGGQRYVTENSKTNIRPPGSALLARQPVPTDFKGCPPPHTPPHILSLLQNVRERDQAEAGLPLARAGMCGFLTLCRKGFTASPGGLGLS